MSIHGHDTARKVRVVIADDHPAVRMGLATVVSGEADMEVVAEVGDGEEAVAQCAARHADVVLMDLRMPGSSGLEAITKMAAAGIPTRAIVLTSFDLEEDIVRALRAGAKGFLVKDSTRAEIVEAIRSVHRGEQIVPPRVQTQLGRRLQREELTQRELEVLQLIVKGKANKEISSALFISEDTVRSHTRALFQKLGVNARTEAAIEAVKLGLVHL
jgi:two-component system, NarL family, response regulator